ncbi:hypothetical protein BDY24DRAFT_1249 [Mrakia frigida]|uniref:uncharacterized protein n=1 Tax=Mrakia frigida TaxID=29902 RepID=UPI003FCBF861
MLATPLPDVVRIATLPRSSLSSFHLARFSSLLKSQGFMSITSNENEIACTGCCSVILALFASSDHPFGDVSISHRWRVFRVDSDGEGSVSDDGNEETRAVESVSEGMGRAGISCFYTASIEADFVLVAEEDFARASAVLLSPLHAASSPSKLGSSKEEEDDPFSLDDENDNDDRVEIVRSGSEEADAASSTFGSSSSSSSHPIDVAKSSINLFDFGPPPPVGTPSHYSSSAASQTSLASNSSLAFDPPHDASSQWTIPLSSSSSALSLRRASSAATATPRNISSLSPTFSHISSTGLPPPPPRIALHPAHLSMVKLPPSSSCRRNHALDAVQLFISDVAEADLKNGGTGSVPSFFSLIKDQGCFSVTGDPILMEKRFDEVTDDQLQEAKDGVAQDEEDQRLLAAADHAKLARPGHRRAQSCPGPFDFLPSTTISTPIPLPFSSSSSNNSSAVSLASPEEDLIFDGESDVHPFEHDETRSFVSAATSAFDEDASCILRCLQVHLTGEEGFKKAGIIRRFSSLLSAHSIPMVYYSTARFANILVPKKDLPLARRILEHA